MSKITKAQSRTRRHIRVRAKISGTAERPRLSIFRSNSNIYAQLVDDTKSLTLASSSDHGVKKGTKTEKATEVGKDIAKKAQEKNITAIVFDRAGYKYHGRVKAIAEAAREAGLKF